MTVTFSNELFATKCSINAGKGVIHTAVTKSSQELDGKMMDEVHLMKMNKPNQIKCIL